MQEGTAVVNPAGSSGSSRRQRLQSRTHVDATLYCVLLASLALLCQIACPQPPFAHAAKVYGRVEIENEHEDSFIFENITRRDAAVAAAAATHKYRYSKAWSLPLMKGIMKGQTLHLRKIENHQNKWHSCYEVHCENTWKNFCPDKNDPASTYSFCYPAVVVTGLPKCGTSAAYDLLSRYTGAITMYTKENCPYTHRRSHWEFFHTLPRVEDVQPGQLVIDGCLDYLNNMRLRRLLHEPDALYIIMTRNYADLVWSSYNFWCKRE